MNMRSRSMKSSIDSLVRSVRFPRRTATVTTSAPDAAWQRAISGKLRYLPVPIIRRERKVRPDIVRDMLTVYVLRSNTADVKRGDSECEVFPIDEPKAGCFHHA